MKMIRHIPPPPPRSKVNLIAVFAALGICTIFSLLLARYWLDRYTFQQAETAYQQGNCEVAMPRFRKLAEARRLLDFNPYRAQAKARSLECEAFLALVNISSPPVDQLLASEAFVRRYAQSPLVTSIQTRTLGLIADTDLATLAVQPLCDRREDLRTQGLVPIDSVPQLWTACGQTYEAEGNYDGAIATYQQVLQRETPEMIVTQVEAALAQVLVAQANTEGANTLSQPSKSGYTRKGATKVQIRNDSPERMRIVFSGPEPHFQEIAPCEDCEAYAIASRKTCPNQGPLATFELEPGNYEVLVQPVSDPTVNPFIGTWSLTAGQAYDSCLYL